MHCIHAMGWGDSAGKHCMRAYRLCAMAETWWQYVQRVTEGATQASIAEAVGVDKATVWRWRSGKSAPKPEVAIRLARVYGRPVSESLVAACAITAEEASITEVVIQANPEDLDDDELIEEIRRRTNRSVNTPKHKTYASRASAVTAHPNPCMAAMQCIETAASMQALCILRATRETGAAEPSSTELPHATARKGARQWTSLISGLAARHAH